MTSQRDENDGLIYEEREVISKVPSKWKRYLKRLFPVFLLLIVVALISYYFIRESSNRSEESEMNIEEGTDGRTSVDSINTKHPVPGGAHILTRTGSVSDDIMTFLNSEDPDLSTIFNYFDLFHDDSSGFLNDEAYSRIHELGQILQHYPHAEIELRMDSPSAERSHPATILAEQRLGLIADQLTNMGIESGRVLTYIFTSEQASDADRVQLRFAAL